MSKVVNNVLKDNVMKDLRDFTIQELFDKCNQCSNISANGKKCDAFNENIDALKIITIYLCRKESNVITNPIRYLHYRGDYFIATKIVSTQGLNEKYVLYYPENNPDKYFIMESDKFHGYATLDMSKVKRFKKIEVLSNE